MLISLYFFEKHLGGIQKLRNEKLCLPNLTRLARLLGKA